MNFGGLPHFLQTSEFPGFADTFCHDGWWQSTQFGRWATKTWLVWFGVHRFCDQPPLRKTSEHVFPEPEDPTICRSCLWTSYCTTLWNRLPLKAPMSCLALAQQREPVTKSIQRVPQINKHHVIFFKLQTAVLKQVFAPPCGTGFLWRHRCRGWHWHSRGNLSPSLFRGFRK